MTETPNAAPLKSWVERVVVKPAQQSFEQVKGAFGPEGKKGVAFGRVAGTGLGLVVAAGALKGKDAEGNERSALVRTGQAVLGLGIAGTSILVGHGRA